MYSAPLTLVSEMSLVHRSGQGIYFRVRGWYDMYLQATDLPHGNSGNGYTPSSRLSDSGFLGAARFSGFDFSDAYYFANFRAGPATWMVRLGRQAIDWGEGIFYPGINAAVNPYDYAWLSMPGAPPLNGGKMPVNRLYGNVALPGGWTLDGFYNLEWRAPTFPGCGTYFSGLDNGGQPGCNMATVAGLPDSGGGARNYYLGKLHPGGYFPGGAPNALLDSRPMTGRPSWNSGWGLSAHTFIEKLETELGFYFTRGVSQAFVNSAVSSAAPADFSINTIFPEGVTSYAVSASSGARDLAFSGQLTFTNGFPTHYNAPDFIFGTAAGVGPMGFMRADCTNAETPNGRECQTYYRTNIVQFQLGGTWQFGHNVGLPDATLTAEAVTLWNTNLPPSDGPGAIRLGRTGNFGEADWQNSVGYTCNPGPVGANGVKNLCQIDGFTTPFSAGYKLRAATTIPRGPALAFVPALTFGHDVVGYSADQMTVVGGRMTLGANLRTVMGQDYYLDLGALWYKRDTTFDGMRDRGYYTIGLGMNVK